MNLRRTPAGQARAAETQPMTVDALAASDRTTITWLGMAGFLVNARGTTLMIDPLLTGFDMPLMYDNPLPVDQVPHLDALLVTHSDNDHCSIETCRELGVLIGQVG